jgi:hypothetical protein
MRLVERKSNFEQNQSKRHWNAIFGIDACATVVCAVAAAIIDGFVMRICTESA